MEARFVWTSGRNVLKPARDKPLRGEDFALGRPRSTLQNWHGRVLGIRDIFGQWRTCAIVATNHHHRGAASMPLTLTDAERAMLNALAAPINKSRQPEFFSAVTAKPRGSRPRRGRASALDRTARTVLA